jgi:hypothetical protein
MNDSSEQPKAEKSNSQILFVNRWVAKIPERALDRAYSAALKIKNIEDDHFSGDRISAQSKLYSQNILDCFIADLNKYLNVIKIRMAEFKITRQFSSNSLDNYWEKIAFIDSILSGYDRKILVNVSETDNSLVRADPQTIKLKPNQYTVENSLGTNDRADEDINNNISQKTGAFPRSIGRTIQKITGELDDRSEEIMLNKFRRSKQKTKSAISFFLLLIIIPILSQQISKEFFLMPLVEKMRTSPEAKIFLNYEMKEDAFRQLLTYEEELKFDNLLNNMPKLSDREIEEKVREKANNIAQEFHYKSTVSISNLFSDLIGLIAFTLVIFFNKKGLDAFKSLLDNIVYDLSDSAKAFIIILFTDIFVGFHSPHGWEVLLESLSDHLGIAPNHNFIFLFIATFPVVLDTVFKYWIFRYLNQISPSAVATLKNMNE